MLLAINHFTCYFDIIYIYIQYYILLHDPFRNPFVPIEQIPWKAQSESEDKANDEVSEEDTPSSFSVGRGDHRLQMETWSVCR